MLLSELTKPQTRKDASAILQGNGYYYMGEGGYGTVLYKPGSPYVIKIFEDQAYLDFVNMVLNNPNEHFPIFYSKPRKINDKYYAIRVEKLISRHDKRSIPSIQDEADWEILDFYLNNKGLPISPNEDKSFYRKMKFCDEWFENFPELQIACNLIIKNLADTKKYSIDMSSSNIMYRGNVIVITDPIS